VTSSFLAVEWTGETIIILDDESGILSALLAPPTLMFFPECLWLEASY